MGGLDWKAFDRNARACASGAPGTFMPERWRGWKAKVFRARQPWVTSGPVALEGGQPPSRETARRARGGRRLTPRKCRILGVRVRQHPFQGPTPCQAHGSPWRPSAGAFCGSSADSTGGRMERGQGRAPHPRRGWAHDAPGGGWPIPRRPSGSLGATMPRGLSNRHRRGGPRYQEEPRFHFGGRPQQHEGPVPTPGRDCRPAPEEQWAGPCRLRLWPSRSRRRRDRMAHGSRRPSSSRQHPSL